MYKQEREPDFYKLYRLDDVPMQWRRLFSLLACFMSYTDATNERTLQFSQIVYTGMVKDKLMQVMGWETGSMYQKGLRELTKCGAIRHLARGVYQVNPTIAAKGSWEYDKRRRQGGVKKFTEYFLSDR